MARVTVNITMPKTDDGELSYIAAAPADHRHSYAGSGLPFQSETHAMDRTPNAGVVRGPAGKVVPVELYWPNSFRDSSTGVIVPPAIHLSWRSGGQELAQVVLARPAEHLAEPGVRLAVVRAAGTVDVRAAQVRLQLLQQQAVEQRDRGGGDEEDPESLRVRHDRGILH